MSGEDARGGGFLGFAQGLTTPIVTPGAELWSADSNAC